VSLHGLVKGAGDGAVANATVALHAHATQDHFQDAY